MVTFLATNYAPGNDLDEHFLRSTIETGGLPGYNFFPHVGKIRIDGPTNAKGAGDTESRRKIFVCKPASAGAGNRPAPSRSSTRWRGTPTAVR